MSRTYAYWIRGRAHAEMALTSIASVRKADPRARVVVLADDYNPADPAPWHCHLAHAGAVLNDGHDRLALPLMLANIEAQCRELATAVYGEQFVFIDADTIVLKPPPEAGHLGVTWRTYVAKDDEGGPIPGIAAQMPFNYGVVTACASYHTIETFLWLRERVRNFAPIYQNWYGNQMALASLVGGLHAQQPDDEVRTVRIPWTLTSHGNPVTVQMLPCERWNYTPAAAGELLDQRGILHFKGHSRHLMEEYARRLELPFISPTKESA